LTDERASSDGGQAPSRLIWIVPGAALAAMAGLAALAFIDTRAPQNETARVELPLGAESQTDATPDATLVEASPDGPLPIIGKDGRKPWQAYARPFDMSDKRPRLAIVVTGLGLDDGATKAAIAELPPQISLGMSPYSHDVRKWIGAARAAGHEVLLGLPLEPVDYPRRDPGPYALLTGLSPQQNIERLKRIMGLGAAYVGFVGLMGDRFTADRASLEPVLEELKARGLLYIDDNDPQQSTAAPLAKALGMDAEAEGRPIDGDPSPQAIDQALAALEKDATGDAGAALGLGMVYPVTVDRVSQWARTLDGKGIALAPATAVVQRLSAAPPPPQQ
jgi:uncharacterized protein